MKPRIPLPKQTEKIFKDASMYDRKNLKVEVPERETKTIVSYKKNDDLYDCFIEFKDQSGTFNHYRSFMNETDFKIQKYIEKIRDVLSDELIDELRDLLQLKYEEGLSNGYDDSKEDY